MKLYSRLMIFAASAVSLIAVASAEDGADRVCPRPPEGAIVTEPPEIHSKNGALDVNLKFQSALDHEGAPRYCYFSDTGLESPTLHVNPGDRLSIHLQNDLMPAGPVSSVAAQRTEAAHGAEENCNGTMGPASTNLHFHGLTLPPVCHQDESIHTAIDPGQMFDYAVQIPANNPPGLYWYHPHPHGFSAVQVQGGASGALIVDGIDSQVPALATLPHRTFILRDQVLSAAESNGADPLKPSWDVSINYVPIRYPRYAPAIIQVRPKERQFWRIVNAAANTIFDLQILYDNVPQPVEVFAVDGTPVNNGPITETAIYLPPGARTEFVLTAPGSGQSARLITQKIDSGPAGDSAPSRPLASFVIADPVKTKRGAPPSAAIKASAAGPSPGASLLELKPVRTRTLYFSQNGNGTENGSGAATKFFLTVVGQPVKSFDMDAPPNIIAQQGTVEDWNIQNTTPEDHIFHIHQVHFQLVAVNGVPVEDPVIRDTIRVPHQQGRTPISSVRLRIDFRDPAIVGDFVYHCHILDHEDKGMMGKIQVLPAHTVAGARLGSSGAREDLRIPPARPSPASSIAK